MLSNMEDKVKNTQILKYLTSLKDTGEASEVVIRLRSAKDIDVVIAVPDEKLKIFKIMLESGFYTKPQLAVDIVNRRREKILLLTKDRVAYEIEVIGKTEFDSHYNLKS